MNSIKIITALVLIAAFGLIVFFWQKSDQKPASDTAVTEAAPTQIPVQAQPDQTVDPNGASSPTEAYIRLYEAVKSKQTDQIKSVMSQKTLSFAEGVAAQQNSTLEKVLENGFTASTFAPALPQTRDERIKEDMGALEVWNEKDKKWEDLPFVKENGGWRLAIGDIFAGTYKSPAKGQAQLEAEASNSNKMVPYDQNGVGAPVPRQPSKPKN